MEAHGILKAFPKVKRSKIVETKDAPPPKKKPGEIVTGSVFQGVSIHILPAGIGKARCEIFQRQITQNGGKIENALGPGVTHVIVEDTMDCERALRLLKADTLPSSVKLVKCSWLSMCISEKRLLDTTAHCLLLPDRDTQGNKSKAKEEPVKHNSTKEDVTQQHDFQTVHEDPAHTMTQTQTQTQEGKDNYGDEDGVSQNDLDALMGGHHPTVGPSSPPDTTAATATATAPPPPSLPGKWVCAQSSVAKCNNHNKHLTDKLEPLAKAYTHKGDRWRALGYSKAINALKSYHKPVTSYEEACQIPGIGHKMADKIMEIMESGHLRKLDHMGEDVPVLELFSNIWGVGAKTALLWYQMGFRTLDDIRTKATLNHTQQIGLKHYDDFLDRMPREEAAAIEKTVREAAHAVDPGLVSVACGSYRRGKATCGDVDVLITHPDGKSHRGIFSKVLHILHESGFLTDDLVSSEDNGEQKKYMGVCRLPGPGQRHRRLDVIVVPHGEFACALLYFTGSAHFNRSMRALAKTKRMSLSEHSLNCNVLRQGAAKVAAGSPLPTHSERDVFTHLGVPYREPHERDW
ncbi:DNA polymerase lambda isoform X2 [Sardina pilchardus]|uniref:DNA polymerase lambda isoform X2 n=1 Tax=Sardina pilchardus TaxID=27697 RepID=UPI002E120312